MKHIILDASVALALPLNENNPYAEKILSDFLEEDDIIHVPYLWHIEVRNILFFKERKWAITRENADKELNILKSFLIRTDQWIDIDSTLVVIESLSRTRWLTTYDASYVELALRLNMRIATLDQKMVQVARELGCFLEL